MINKIISVIVLMVVCMSLVTGCQAIGPGPNLSTVKAGLNMQLNLIQSQLNQEIKGTKSATYQVTRVKIAEQEPLIIENLQGFKVDGFYDSQVKFIKQIIKQKNQKFSLYFQRDKQAQSWRLARPIPQAGQDNQINWATYLINNQ